MGNNRGKARFLPYRFLKNDKVFVRSGNIRVSIRTGTFRYASNFGEFWSSRGASVTNAHYFEFTDITMRQADAAREHAFPLRCLSTVLGM